MAAEPESATEASDAELAGRVRGGDRAAEAELFRRLAPRVRLYGLRHLRDPAAADDLVQDVLLMTFDSLRAGKVREHERKARTTPYGRRSLNRRSGARDKMRARWVIAAGGTSWPER